MSNVTRILAAIEQGDSSATEQLLPLGMGGGIYSSGSLTLESSTVKNKKAAGGTPPVNMQFAVRLRLISLIKSSRWVLNAKHQPARHRRPRTQRVAAEAAET